MLDLGIREFGITFFPSLDELLPFYEQAIATGDEVLMAEVERVCGDCFSCDAEDLPALCKEFD